MTRHPLVDLDLVPPEVRAAARDVGARFPDGRIDYHLAASAPVVNVFVTSGWGDDRKLLLVKRSGKIGWMKNRWHVVAGFLDELLPLRAKVMEELIEEIGVVPQRVRSLRAIGPVDGSDTSKRWIVYCAFAHIDSPEVALDWESVQCAWVGEEEFARYELTPIVAACGLEALRN